jgi:branched-chain amino acid transport system ATP-binding protein
LSTADELLSHCRASSGSPARHLLSVEGISVRFGGLVANNDISLDCAEGSVTALLGPNGAGKTTLFDVITGARRPAAGRVWFGGRDVTRFPPYQRARLGMARTFQNLSLARGLSVFENVFVGAARYRHYGSVAAALRLPRVRRDDAGAHEITARAIDIVGLSDLTEVPVGDLAYGDLRRVELARALALGPRLLMLDEPTAGMDRGETAELAKALLTMKQRWALTIFVVEHDIEFVQLVADWAYVLDFGRVLAQGEVSTVLADQAVRDAYLGTMKDA